MESYIVGHIELFVQILCSKILILCIMLILCRKSLCPGSIVSSAGCPCSSGAVISGYCYTISCLNVTACTVWLCRQLCFCSIICIFFKAESISYIHNSSCRSLNLYRICKPKLYLLIEFRSRKSDLICSTCDLNICSNYFLTTVILYTYKLVV